VAFFVLCSLFYVLFDIEQRPKSKEQFINFLYVANNLPRGSLDSGQLAFFSQFTKTDAAQFKITHIAVIAAAAPAPSNLPGGKLRFSFRFYY